MDTFDLFVIGTGPAGLRGAIQAAKLGKRVGICDRREDVGGVCIHTGTIPSKTLREAILYLTGYYQQGIYGLAARLKEVITAEDLLSRSDHVIARENDVMRDQLRRNGVAMFGGEARFVDPHRLQVSGKSGIHEVGAEFVLIATGTRPAPPPGVELDRLNVITSDGVPRLQRIPRSLTVVGAGVIGVEYASMFAALGIEVTLIDKRERLLDFVDGEIAETLSCQMRSKGATLRLGEEVASIRVLEPGRVLTELASGKKIVSEMVLYSVGRQGATEGLGLEAAGLTADARGRLTVDENLRTAVPHIYAAGDVIGFPALASTSFQQGRRAACHAFGVPASGKPDLSPYGIYSVPEISMAGQNEEQLTRDRVPYEIGVARYREIARGTIRGDEAGLLKLLVHAETRRILGVHILGAEATELIHIGQAAMHFEGTLDYFVDAVFNYPTFAECYKVAALDAMNKLAATPAAAGV